MGGGCQVNPSGGEDRMYKVAYGIRGSVRSVQSSKV